HNRPDPGDPDVGDNGGEILTLERFDSSIRIRPRTGSRRENEPNGPGGSEIGEAHDMVCEFWP
ncbi:MAG TPA: hypothetical protein VG406_14000, partial [Isosphaeraceae bacterium]|nr:hypothetical protein [Isosphaeraceae bacterium]